MTSSTSNSNLGIPKLIPSRKIGQVSSTNRQLEIRRYAKFAVEHSRGGLKKFLKSGIREGIMSL